jgi:uncharacterized membrane protein
MYTRDKKVDEANKRVTIVLVVTLITELLWSGFWVYQAFSGKLLPAFFCVLIQLVGLIVIVALAVSMFKRVGKIRREDG